MLEQQNGKLIAAAAGRRHKDVGSCVYAVLVMTMLQFVVMQLHILFQRLCMQAVQLNHGAASAGGFHGSVLIKKEWLNVEFVSSVYLKNTIVSRSCFLRYDMIFNLYL
jgi:hypothetical protein